MYFLIVSDYCSQCEAETQHDMDYATSTHSSVSTEYSSQTSFPTINIMSGGSTIPFAVTSTTNSTTVPYQLNNENNLTHHDKLLNTSIFMFTCPSNEMPAGNLISMILYAIVCIIGLFGNTLVIYVVLRFQKMKTVIC
jgi:hypothetical protein